VGDLDRVFRAIDVKTGEEVWRTRLPTSVQGFPVTFTANGKQYVAVSTGLGGGSALSGIGTCDGKWAVVFVALAGGRSGRRRLRRRQGGWRVRRLGRRWRHRHGRLGRRHDAWRLDFCRRL
jgi:hypothetical protein